MTLYLKYRPQKIEELDLKSVRESLKKIIKSKSIPHAFLFSGPKGTGKTSAARIIAKVINCESASTKLRGPGKIEPCNKCSQCASITKGENLDVIEMDAASHRGIDDVRALRDAVKLAPAKAKKKVYIIDEAHMLTTEASNALLKTLEEPPDHVVFILATTNPEKLIETIRSRTVNIAFTNATKDEIVRSLKKKIKGEKLKVEEGVVDLIAEFSDKSFRDADKILEKLIAEKVPLKKQVVSKFLSERSSFETEKFISLLINRGAKNALEMIEKVVFAGGSIQKITQTIIGRLREALLAKVGIGEGDIDDFSKSELVLLIKLLSKSLAQIQDTLLEQIPLEIAVVEWCEEKGIEGTKSIKSIKGNGESGSENKNQESRIKNQGEEKDNGKRTMENKNQGSGVNKASVNRLKNPKLKNVSQESISQKLGVNGNGVSDEIWSKILAEIRPKNTSTEALLRAAKPVSYDGNRLTLGVFYSFHKERLESVPHRNLLEEVVSNVFGDQVRVMCTLCDPPKKKVDQKDKAESDLILTEGKDEDIIKVAKEIFGN